MLIMRECIGQILSKRSEMVRITYMSPCYKIVIELSEWELVPFGTPPHSDSSIMYNFSYYIY